jgi:ABC-type transport system involved in cytochrome c biogenesis ATPase subunit
MLKEVSIKHFRSCADVTLDDIGPVTALIGRNASGKSNVLKAIATLADLAGSSGPDLACWDEAPFVPREQAEAVKDTDLFLGAVIAMGNRSYEYSTRVSRFIDVQNAARPISVSLEEELKSEVEGKSDFEFRRTRESITVLHGQSNRKLGVGEGVSAMHAIGSLLPANDPVLAIIEPLRRFFGGIRYYPLDEPADVAKWDFYISDSEYAQWLSDYQTSGRLGQIVSPQILYLHLAADGRFQELVDRVGPNGLRLVDDIVVQQMKTEWPGREDARVYLVQFRIGTDGRERLLSFSRLSQGTRRIVRLATAMAFGNCPVMLLEHPEDGIHKGLVRKVAGLFTPGMLDGQLILSTHSDTLMNLLEPDSIRFVGIENGWTVVRKLTGMELQGASHYVSSDVDGTLAEFLHSVEY